MNKNKSTPRKKFSLSFENLIAIFAFVMASLMVDLFYSTIVNKQIEIFKGKQSAGLIGEKETSPWIIMDGTEQQLTIILFFISLVLLLYKFILIYRERSMLSIDIIDLPRGRIIPREEASEFAEEMEERLPKGPSTPLSFALPSYKEFLVTRAFKRALQRFNDDKSAKAEEVSHTITTICENELNKLESQLAIINYIAWAIPSVGFIGTVRGIGLSLAAAGSTVGGGDISVVTDSLGLAFNSTLVSLLVSMFLMFFISILKRNQESFVMESEEFCQKRLLSHI